MVLVVHTLIILISLDSLAPAVSFIIGISVIAATVDKDREYHGVLVELIGEIVEEVDPWLGKWVHLAPATGILVAVQFVIDRVTVVAVFCCHVDGILDEGVPPPDHGL